VNMAPDVEWGGNQLPVFCHKVAAWDPDLFCNFYIAKNHKITNKSTTTKARENISTDWESLDFFKVCWTKFKNSQILLNRISHRFLLTTKLYTGWKILILTRGKRSSLFFGRTSDEEKEFGNAGGRCTTRSAPSPTSTTTDSRRGCSPQPPSGRSHFL